MGIDYYIFQYDGLHLFRSTHICMARARSSVRLRGMWWWRSCWRRPAGIHRWCGSDDEDTIDEAEAMVADRSIRQVHIPRLRFQCRSYPKMVDWNKELKTEPPLISRLSDDEVTRILDNPLELPDLCNHAQAVERAIKAVTESFTAVTGAGERNGCIRQRTRSRKIMPKFNTKKDYCSNM